jgi:DNA-binding LytR/AlgR family response regulator
MRNNDIPGGATKSVDKNWIGLIAKTESLKVPYSEVLYIEQVGKNLRIHKDTGILDIPGRISKISKVVCEPFFQCHSYLLINLSRVDAMVNGRIIFDNQKSTSLGEGNYHKTRKKFNQYLLGEAQYSDKSVQKRTK